MAFTSAAGTRRSTASLCGKIITHLVYDTIHLILDLHSQSAAVF
jgi:hypothetical protein